MLDKAGSLPRISLEDVEERSSADLIAKIIVISKVGWFAVEVISRLVTRLPVTPLEAHTFVHVGCAVVMYALWWEKPYNINRPILLSDAISKQIGTLLVFRNALQEVVRQDQARYDVKRERHWRTRVMDASNNIPDHDPPPIPPVCPSIDKAVEIFCHE